jgi:hypothetical protein
VARCLPDLEIESCRSLNAAAVHTRSGGQRIAFETPPFSPLTAKRYRPASCSPGERGRPDNCSTGARSIRFPTARHGVARLPIWIRGLDRGFGSAVPAAVRKGLRRNGSATPSSAGCGSLDLVPWAHRGRKMGTVTDNWRELPLWLSAARACFRALTGWPNRVRVPPPAPMRTVAERGGLCNSTAP